MRLGTDYKFVSAYFFFGEAAERELHLIFLGSFLALCFLSWTFLSVFLAACAFLICLFAAGSGCLAIFLARHITLMFCIFALLVFSALFCLLALLFCSFHNLSICKTK